MEKDKSKRLRTIIIAEVCAVVVVAGVVGGVIYFKKNPMKKASTTEVTIVTQAPVVTADPFVDESSTLVDETTTLEGITNPDGTPVVPSTVRSSSSTKKPSSSGTKSTTVATTAANAEDPNSMRKVKNKAIEWKQNWSALMAQWGILGPEAGILGYAWDEENQCFKTKDKSWQQYFGFNTAYDVGAAATYMYYDTVRVKFKYANNDWMIQLWKGQYGAAFLGAEIGVYKKDPGQTIEHYSCATNEADQLVMSASLSSTVNGKTEHLFTIKPDSFWWLTGFVFGALEDYADRSQLTMKGTITLKDAAMRDAFVAAFNTVIPYDQSNTPLSSTPIFVKGNTYTVSGNTVSFTW